MEELPMLVILKLAEQVPTNLLTNAMNYTPAGGTIKLQTGIARPKVNLGCSWADTDRISDKDKQHLFERFYCERPAVPATHRAPDSV
jgi:K+-sensing histidine kinase KdpD